MLKIDFSPQAEAFIEKIPRKHAGQILTRIERLALNPDDVQSEQLSGFAPKRRFKSGEYRVIFVIENGTLIIELIGKRNDDSVYKLLKR